MKKRIINKQTILFLLVELVIILFNNLIVKKYTVCSNGISIISMVLVTMLLFVGFVISESVTDNRLKRVLKGVAIISLVALCAETLIFNLKSFDTDNKIIEFSQYSDISNNNSENVEINGDSVIIKGDSEIYLDINKKDINALQIEFDGQGDNSFNCYVAIKDGNLSRKFIKIGEKKTSPSFGRCDFSFSSFEELQAIEIGFINLKDSITINKISYSKALPFCFSEIRFYAMLLFLTLLWIIWVFKLYKIEYDRKNIRHFIVILAITIASALSMLLFLNPNEKDIKYNDELNMRYQNPYVQMFDALHNHRFDIAIEPSEELLNMDNPYDDSVRAEEGVDFAWDRAFYNGKYYSYYGIAPVLTFYYPYYFITSKLPSMNKACVFFGMLSIVFLYGLIFAFVKKFIKKPNFLLLVITLIASAFASGISFMVDFSDMYALPGVTGTCFLMLCLWCGFEAYGREGGKLQKVLFALCGIAFILCLASKPTRALSCLVLAPAFIEILISKNRSVKEKIISAGSFLLPVFIGMGLIMMYNNARFSSPFDFGATYQLTVSNVNANSLRVALLPDAMLHFFLQPVQMKGVFPFVEIGKVYFANSQTFIYNDFAVGAFSMPMILLGVFFMPYVIYEQRNTKENTVSNNVKNATYIMMFVMAIIIAWFNYCVAGIILSYVCDILPILAIMSVFVILEAANYFNSDSIADSKVVNMISIILVINAILVILELLSFDKLALNSKFPDLIYLLEEMICFWN